MLERRDVQRCPETEHALLVVERVARRKLVQKPEPLLGERQLDRAFIGPAWDRLSRGALQLATQPFFEQRLLVGGKLGTARRNITGIHHLLRQFAGWPAVMLRASSSLKPAISSIRSASMTTASWVMVGDSNSRRKGRSTPNASRRRETSWVASSECPPSS